MSEDTSLRDEIVPARVDRELESAAVAARGGIITATPVDLPPSEAVQRPGLQLGGGPVAAPRAPLVDIVMLVHDQAKWADLSIRAVEHHTRNAYRLIVVDSASVEPATKALLADVERRGHTVIHLAENRSFSSGVNVGAEAGDSKFICILNDDALVTEGWDSAMLQDAAVRTTGLVGARSNYASGHQGDPSSIGEPPYLVFVCVALRREIWDIVGPMDEETFDGFSAEDIDYSWRVKKAGYGLKVSAAYVLHAGSRTLAARDGSPEALARNNQKYNEKLVQKWGKDFAISHSQAKSRVLVATFHAEDWTRVDFMGSLMGLKNSEGHTFSYYHCKRMPIQMARAAVADYALDAGYDILIQLDDDALFPVDLLRRLLSHQKDVVSALAYQRKPPHWPCVFEVGEDGLMGKPLEGIEGTGLRKIDATGFHCSAIRTSVFKRLRDGVKDAEGKVIVPGTKLYYGGFDNKLGEDFAMSTNLRRIGIQIYCDTDLVSGHIGDSRVVDAGYVAAFKAGRTV